ncbi:carbohydrate kinase [Bradyrhizobium tropiciagri]|uniref:FGGY-family carbohydrate kinase n=1 Tax=Bradyrhizobium tropiciagri TaxID=312253 RepID=UPI001BA917E1|nr:FGGY-family carbohydrate kinase [Bradyrhizobium tropiciagri]MBR0898991.1 carbohydrate kinase [Bradyrhizobium tropiciagri]
MTDPLLLAIDVGTTVLKVILFRPDGSSARVAQRATPLSSPRQGWVEMDMDGLWRLVADTTREVSRGYADRIATIAICGFSSGLFLVDADGRPVRPGIVWNDSRCASLIESWHRSGTMDRIFEISGSAIYPGFSLPLLNWIQSHEPASIARSAHFLACKDWLRLCLTDTVATDQTDASYFPYDVHARNHSRALLDLCGIGGLERLLPPIAESGALAGTLTTTAAERLGLAPEIPVVVGMCDFSSATYATGAVRPGQACTALGTACLNNLIMDSPASNPFGVGLTGATLDGRWLRTLSNTAGTVNIDWFANTFYGGASAQVINQITVDASSIPIGADGITYLPYISTAGVSAPFVHPHARGQFFGISSEHRRPQFARAVFEGVALSIRDAYEAMPVGVEEIRLVGGGAGNEFWCQMIADCTGRTVLVPNVTYASGWGVARLAAEFICADTDDQRNSAACTVRRYESDRRRTAAYVEVFALYKEISAAGVELWTRRARTFEKILDIG